MTFSLQSFMHIYLIFKTKGTVNESLQYLKKIDQVVFLLCHILKITFADIVIKVKEHSPTHTKGYCILAYRNRHSF